MAEKLEAKQSCSSFTANWLKENHELYIAATNHSFIQSIRDGTIDVNNFKKWMVSVLAPQSFLTSRPSLFAPSVEFNFFMVLAQPWIQSQLHH